MYSVTIMIREEEEEEEEKMYTRPCFKTGKTDEIDASLVF